MKLIAITATAAALLLTGCSQAPNQAKKAEEPKKAPEALGGQSAFFKMYVSARSWAPDAQILMVNSIQLDELKAEPGKSAAWQAVFVSPSKLKTKTYTWSAVESAGNLHEGVFGQVEDGYNGRGKPMLTAALKIDTPAAYKIAAEKAAEYVKKNPNQRVNFQLEKSDKHPNPSWRVFWGDSVSGSPQSVFVDATLGTWQETRR
ncbi:MAG: hypothetical protein FJW30_03300 [Acidobacteria bacterium]|nr:hypothetical protein [Acidobacteriota bacterium]